MGIADDYLKLIHAISEQLRIPRVRAIHIAPFAADQEKSSKFGAMVLVDGTVGLTYTALDDAWSDLQDRAKTETLLGVTPVEAAQLYGGESAWQRCVGMAAVNAISQFVFKASGCALAGMGKTIGQLALGTDDHVGMVGYFPPLVEQIRSRGLSLTVVELDERWLQNADGFEVTLDPERLRCCNKIVCTGTVLINQTIDSVLACCDAAEQILIVGPTSGCLPDPLFERGVTSIGGSIVVDAHAFIERWEAQEEWRGATQRYVLRSDGYPGYQALLGKIKRNLEGGLT